MRRTGLAVVLVVAVVAVVAPAAAGAGGTGGIASDDSPTGEAAGGDPPGEDEDPPSDAAIGDAAAAYTTTPTPDDGRPAVITGDAVHFGATQVGMWANVSSEAAPGVVWFEYRRVRGDGDWQRTRRGNVSRPGLLILNATDLRPATGYEYRAVVATSAGKFNGSVRTFKTRPPANESDGSTPTPTPYVMPTPTATPTPTPTSFGPTGPSEQSPPPDAGGGGDDFLPGWTTLLLVVGGVPLVGGVVLGALVLGLGLHRTDDDDG